MIFVFCNYNFAITCPGNINLLDNLLILVSSDGVVSNRAAIPANVSVDDTLSK